MTIEFDEMGVVSAAAASRGGGRRRVVVGVAAAMLVAAAGGVGYGIGRNVDGDTASTSSAADTDVDAATVPTVDVIDETPRTTDAPTDTIDELGDDATEYSDVDVGGVISGSGGVGYAAFGSEPTELLAERVTASGFTLRASLGQRWDPFIEDDWGAGDWRPAPWCFESAQLRIAMAGNGVIDVGGVGWYSEPFQGRAVSSVLLGASDGSPQWVVVAQVSADVTNVGVVFADGSVDQAAPQNGIALLTGPGVLPVAIDEGDYTHWEPPTAGFELTFDGSGVPVALGSDDVGTWDDPEFRKSCSPPPPALPEPGEQPADPAAAEAEVRAAMTTLYGVVGTDDVGVDLIDDPTGVEEARAQVQSGGFADDAAGAAASIDELVFTTPTEAWFRYSIDTPGNDFDNRYGMAVAIDGVWKVTRDTICQDLSLAGGDCGAGWQSVYPPGAFAEGEFVDEGDIESVTPVTTTLVGD